MNKYNTVGRRIWAGLIDGLLFLPFSLLGSFIADDRLRFFLLEFLFLVLWSIYTITLHSVYGQTLGKNVLGIKVCDVTEGRLISMKKSAIRESIWITGQLFILVVFTIKMSGMPQANAKLFESHENVAAAFTIFWSVTQLISMLMNAKKRSIEDRMGNSVVIKLPQVTTATPTEITKSTVK